MTEDEIIDKINYMINNWHRNVVEIDIQWIQGLLDLYQQEKGNRRMAERNYDELTKTTGRLKTELEEEKKKVRTTIIGRIDQVSLDDLIGDKYISKDKIKEKIESIENMSEVEVCDEEINYRLKIEDKAKIEVLKELLEEE